MKSIWRNLVDRLEKRQERVRNQLASRLISSDEATRQRALDEAWATGSKAWLEAVEEAIRHLSDRDRICFYEPDGMSTGDADKAYRELIRLARQDQLLRDPAFTQWLMSDVNGHTQQLVNELAEMGGRELTLFRLLQLQMGLRKKSALT